MHVQLWRDHFQRQVYLTQNFGSGLHRGASGGGIFTSMKRFHTGPNTFAEGAYPAKQPLDYADRVFGHGQSIAAPRHGLDQEFGDHLIAQGIAQAFDAGGPCRLVAIGGIAA
jgi:hypothetical protein